MGKKVTGHLKGSPDSLFQLHLRSHWKPTGDVSKKKKKKSRPICHQKCKIHGDTELEK